MLTENEETNIQPPADQAAEENSVIQNEQQSANNRNFFQNNKYTLMALLIAGLSGGTFAAFYLGAISVSAIVVAVGKIGLDIAFLESMSLLAASATLAGAAAGIATAFTTATYAISSGLSAFFKWATQPTTPSLETTPEELQPLVSDEDKDNAEQNNIDSANTLDIEQDIHEIEIVEEKKEDNSTHDMLAALNTIPPADTTPEIQVQNESDTSDDSALNMDSPVKAVKKEVAANTQSVEDKQDKDETPNNSIAANM